MYDVLWPGLSCPSVRLQLGASGSLTTLVRTTLPIFVTVMVKMAVPPLGICCRSGVLAMTTPGFINSTTAVSWLVTGLKPGSGVPFGSLGVPVTVAMLVKPAVTPVREQV